MPKIQKTRNRPTSARWLAPLYGGFALATTSQTPTVGRVNLMEFEVTAPSVIDQISWANGATVAGNVTVGVYGPLATEGTALGAAVAVQSASTAQAGISAMQAIDLTPTFLAPGRYYAAIEFDNVTATFLRHGSTTQPAEYVQNYDRSGGYGALTNPCPTPTSGGTLPGLRIRTTAVGL